MFYKCLKLKREFKFKQIYINIILGFIVKALDLILEKTLICEYVGEVDFARNKIFDENDSIMDLLRTSRS